MELKNATTILTFICLAINLVKSGGSDDWPFLTQRKDLPTSEKLKQQVEGSTEPSVKPDPFPSQLMARRPPPRPVDPSKPPILPSPPKPVVMTPPPPPPAPKETFVVKERDGCTVALIKLLPEGHIRDITCPPVYKVDLGFTPTVDDPGQQPLLNRLLDEIDRDIDALSYPYSYALLHVHPRYPRLVKAVQKRWKEDTIYFPVLGDEHVIMYLRTFLGRLDGFVLRRDKELKRFEETLLKKYSEDELFGLTLEMLPYNIYSRGIPTPLPNPEILAAIRGDEEFLSKPLLGTKLPERLVTLREAARERLYSMYYPVLELKFRNGELDRDTFDWYLRLKSYDEAVITRYKTFNRLRKAVEKSLS